MFSRRRHCTPSTEARSQYGAPLLLSECTGVALVLSAKCTSVALVPPVEYTSVALMLPLECTAVALVLPLRVHWCCPSAPSLECTGIALVLPAEHTGAALVLLAEDTCVALVLPAECTGALREWQGKGQADSDEHGPHAPCGGLALVSNLFRHFKTLQFLRRFWFLPFLFIIYPRLSTHFAPGADVPMVPSFLWGVGALCSVVRP